MNPISLNTFYQKKWKLLCLSSYTMYSAFTFQRTSNSKNNELLLLLFDGLWNLKAYVVLCLNASA